MLRRKNREIMVFSISFLDVIASALGAILILFIIQYNKTQTARTEAVVSEARHSQCTAALAEFARQDPLLAAATPYDDVTAMPFDKTTRFEHEKETEHPHPEEPAMAPPAVVPKAPMNVSPVQVRPRPAAEEPGVPGMQAGPDSEVRSLPQTPESDTEPPKSETSEPAAPPALPMAEPAPQEDRRIPTAQDAMEPAKEPPRPAKADANDMNPERPAEEKSQEKAEKRILPELPAGHEGKTLATCVTARESVEVRFWDHDQPDGDTIMVSWNGRNMTRIRLEEKASTRYVFPLTKGRYNIVVIKNISNGFYPLNTASVSISGCGQARWKIRDVGDSRVIYIYRE